MNAIAIIQARMGSSRLPGKVLADIAGRPMLQRIVERVRATPGICEVVVATTTNQADDVLVDWCGINTVSVYRGSIENVLDRFWQCAQLHKSELIVRVTADDPLKDPEIIRNALDLCSSSCDIDYVSNTLRPTYPEGLDIEVIRYHALERAAIEAAMPAEREHVTPFIWKNPELFELRGFSMEPDLSHWRWTVDKPADLEFVRRIYSHFYDKPFVSYREVIKWLEENPELLTINSGTIRNEGYLKTLSQESTK